MKRIFALILAMLMLLSAGAFAEEAGNNGDLMIIRETQDGASDDYDGDGKTEALSFAAKLDEYGDGSFTIGVGDQTLSIDGCMALSGKVYALKLAFGSYYNPVGFWGTLFMANEFGPSDDPLTYCFFYTDGNAKTQVFDKFELHIPAGQRVGLVGMSGAGKTTVLNMLGGMDRCDSGDIILDGERVSEYSFLLMGRT